MNQPVRIASRLFIAILSILLIVQPALAGPLAKQGSFAAAADTGPTVFEIFYGPTQTFGTAGQPQPQVNILGKVSDPDGVDTLTLTYTLNGGLPQPLSMGPDTRRLYDPGEFNVELWYDELNPGANTVVIKAAVTETLATFTETTVTVNKVSGSVSVPYNINWGAAGNISDVAQVVDGKWSLSAAGVKTEQIGYDRLIAVGEMDWTDYEVTVPVTVHDVVPNGYVSPSYGPAVGLILGWNGHTDNPVSNTQPLEGYFPYGAIAAYRWEDDSGENDGLKLYIDDDVKAEDSAGFTITEGVTYIFKVRVETNPDGGVFYRFKAWQGAVEPAQWNLYTQGPVDGSPSGSILLQAHHVDVTFGNVTVAQISDATGPVINSIESAPFSSSAVITWNTDEPSTSVVNYGPTTGYGDVVEDLTLVTSHSVVVSGLTPSTLYHFTVGGEDQHENSSVSVDQSFTTLAPGGTPGIDSDDFNACTLNTGIWTYINPNPPGDPTLSMVGPFTADARLSIALPAGTDHDMHDSDEGGNLAPRIMQVVDNTDFELEAKFDSQVSTMYQMQGILVEQDVDLNYLRFEFYSDGTDVHVTVYKYVGGDLAFANGDVLIPQAEGSPSYMRVKRVGPQWTFSYSYDRQTWILTHSFTHVVTVKSVGAYGANAAGESSPAHTALLDYFFNTAAPIAQEDAARNSLTINKVGSGEVVRTPAKESYNCSESVALDANPAPGYKFAGWSGDITGISNPLLDVANVTMTAGRVITATFTAEEYLLTLLPAGHGELTADPVKEKYHYGDSVTLTATPDASWFFGGWTVNGVLVSSANPYTFEIQGNTTVAASFTQNFYTLLVTPVGQGTVIIAPASGPYPEGSQVTLTAVPAPGYEFGGWGGGLSSSDNPLKVDMTKNLVLTATFTEIGYSLTLVQPEHGVISVSPLKQKYSYGDMLTLTAAGQTGWVLDHWIVNGQPAGNSNPLVIPIVGDTTVSVAYTDTSWVFIPSIFLNH